MLSNEQKIFGLLLNDDRELLDTLRFGVQLTVDDLSPDAGALWLVVNDIATGNNPVLPGIIAQYSTMTENELRDLQDVGFGVGRAEAIAYAEKLVKDTDKQRAIHSLSVANADILKGKPLHEVQAQLATALTQHRGMIIQQADTFRIHERIDERRKAGILLKVTKTNVAWFDYMLDGGFRNKAFIAIGGRQKGRKTSILRNLLLGAATQYEGTERVVNPDVSIALMAFENDQEITYYDLVAMEAMRWCVSNEHHQKMEGKKLGVARLGGGILQTAYENGKLDSWPKYLKDAVAFGMSVVDQLNIAVYDSRPENGNLTSLNHLKMAMEMHVQTHTVGTEHVIFAIDYAQLVTNIGKDYEDMKTFSEFGLWASQHYDATVIALSQFNEAANFAKVGMAKNKKNSFLGTKGGGSLEAAVQNYFVTDYDEQQPNGLRVEQARARRSGWGETTFDIHPASGLIW